jgi:hypothetical protein
VFAFAPPSLPRATSVPSRAPSPKAPQERLAPADADPLEGVPLQALAACVTDQREEALKQQLLAAVTTQEECTSDSGRYRFVGTRNQNAFLMWIQPAAGAPPGDRCAELERALACLRRQGAPGGNAR